MNGEARVRDLMANERMGGGGRMEGYQSLEAVILAHGDLRPGRALHVEGEGVSGPSRQGGA